MKSKTTGWALGCIAMLSAASATACGGPASGPGNSSRAAAVANVDSSTVEGACTVITTYEQDFAVTTAIIEANLASQPDVAASGYTSMSLQYHEAALRVDNAELSASLTSIASAFGDYATYQQAVVDGTTADIDTQTVLDAATTIANSSKDINGKCGTFLGATSTTPSSPPASVAPSGSGATSPAPTPTPQAGNSVQDDCVLINSYDPQLIAIADKTQAALEKDPAGAAAGYKQTAGLYEEMAAKVSTPELKAALEKEQAAMVVYFKYQQSTASGNLGANSYDKVTAAAKQIDKADKVIIGICGSSS